MQLIWRNDVSDYAKWKQVFDDDTEDRTNAGLSLLQLWRDADDANRVFGLFEVSDRDAAQAFLDGPTADITAPRGGVTASEYHFVQTA